MGRDGEGSGRQGERMEGKRRVGGGGYFPRGRGERGKRPEV